jgi:hypothetical protein
MKGALRNPQAYLDAAMRRRTERFDDLFPRRITFGDLDSIVEIGGRILVLEWKLVGQRICPGQAGLFKTLVAFGITVIVVWTNEGGNVVAWNHWLPGARTIDELPGDEHGLRSAIANWIGEAER